MVLRGNRLTALRLHDGVFGLDGVGPAGYVRARMLSGRPDLDGGPVADLAVTSTVTVWMHAGRWFEGSGPVGGSGPT